MKTEPEKVEESKEVNAEGLPASLCYAHSAIKKAFEQCDKGSSLKSWQGEGWTLDQVMRCCLDYEIETKENLSFGEIEDAIYRSNISGGLAPTRQEYFFLGWKANNLITLA